MKIFFLSLFFVFYSFDLEASSLSAYPTVLVNPSENIKVTIVPFKDKNDQGLNDALVQIKGPAAEREGIDGEIILHRAIPSGNGYNLQIERANGRTYDRISSRKAWGIWSDVRVWFGGNNFRLYVDDEASKKVDLKSFKEAVKADKSN